MPGAGDRSPKPGSSPGVANPETGSPEWVITSRFRQSTIAVVRNPQLEGNIVLEWRPRVITLVLVLVLSSLVRRIEHVLARPFRPT